MSDQTKLAALYAAIPSFTCLEGCSDCCGPVPMAKAEWQKVKLAKRLAGLDCLSCAYLVDSKCSIYADRPFICRLFGATEDAKLACPHGCGPAKPLTLKQTNILSQRYFKLIDATGPAILTADVSEL